MPRIRNSKPNLLKTARGYELLAPYRYRFIDPATEDRAYFDIPAGFEYDGATDFGFLHRKDADTRADALAHDWGYEKLGHVEAMHDIAPDDDSFSLTRKELDIIFERALAYDANEQSWRRNFAYTVIRVFGAIFWWRRQVWTWLKRNKP